MFNRDDTRLSESHSRLHTCDAIKSGRQDPGEIERANARQSRGILGTRHNS